MNIYLSERTNPIKLPNDNHYKIGNRAVIKGNYNKGVSVYDKLYDKFNEIRSLPQNTNSLQHASVAAIVQDEDDKLWIAMDGGGIDIFDRKNHNATILIKLSSLK